MEHQKRPDGRPSLAVTGASKTFNGIRVLHDVSFDLERGEVCALIGENGSGKSTLIKILSGFYDADPGLNVHLGGVDVTGQLKAGAERTGMAFIHQDLALVPSMTILENLRITRFCTGLGGRIRWAEERARVRTLLARVGMNVSPDTRVDALSVTERALVAISRGLAEIADTDHEGRLLVLDEPTAYLPHDGVERLFHVLRDLSDEGVTILFVSHRLDEVIAHCGRVLVLRNGRLVADEPVQGHASDSLVGLMLGQAAGRLYPPRDGTNVRASATPALLVEELSGAFCRGLSFVAAPGDIVGFIGLPGGGYDEIPYLISGARPATGRVRTSAGTLHLAGLDSATAIRHGVVLVPADRKGASAAMGMSVAENMTLPTMRRFTWARGILRHAAEREAVRQQLERFAAHPVRTDMKLGLMSGGNQQKVVLAKWVMADPQILALHEPTQGVDVAAKSEVFTHLVGLADQGKVVLVSSVEYEDLAHLCDRVHVIRDGALWKTLEGAQLTAGDLATAVYS